MSGQLEKLAGTVAAKVLLDAIRASERLSDLGVPHTLIGGLAVGVHGHARATKDARGEVPVIPVEALILLKLHADRPQDRADVVALLHTGVDTTVVTRYLRDHAPELVARFAELVPLELET